MAVNITTRKDNVKNMRSHALNATKKRQDLNLQVYRLEDGDESIGIDDYFKSEGICIIEWAELIEDSLPNERLDISKASPFSPILSKITGAFSTKQGDTKIPTIRRTSTK